MFSEKSIAAAAESMLAKVNVPPAVVSEILRKSEVPIRANRAWPVFARPAIAAAAVAAVAFIALPTVAPAVVQSVEARYRAALQALGGVVPPSPPQAFLDKLTPQSTTLAQAQSRVRFTIVPPTGLPSDVASSSIHVAPTGFYAKPAHAWSVGDERVTFQYHRNDGREFVLMAAKYDPHDPPANVLFEAKALRTDGRPVLVKHEMFAWRNGNQVLTAIEGRDLTAAEIGAIQSAMHGAPVARRAHHGAASDVFFHVIPKP